MILSIAVAILSPVSLYLIGAALYYRGKAVRLAVDGEYKDKKIAQLQGLLDEQGREVRAWKGQSVAAEWRASIARQDAERLGKRLGELEAKIKADAPPKDAQGAIDWLAKVADAIGDSKGGEV